MDRSRSLEESYDVIVIGGGLAGLTTGALLAGAGRKTLVLERDAEPGGYARALRRSGYTFDRADHLIMGASPQSPFGPGVIDAVLQHLGVADRCEVLRVDAPFYEARFPDFTLAVPAGRDAFLEAHLRHFPGEARGLRRLLELSGRMFDEFLRFPIDPGIAGIIGAPLRYPTLFRYRNATMAQVMDAQLSDARLKSVYETLWPWIASPPSKASFVMWATMMGSFIDDGPYYYRGGLGNLVDALVWALRQRGGTLALGQAPERILTDGGRVLGVILQGGKRVAGPVVISAIDARTTVELVGAEAMGTRHASRLTRMQPTGSVAALYLATDLDVRALGVHHDTTIYAGWDHEEAYAQWLRGDIGMVVMAIPSLTDPSLAPLGEHVVLLQAAVPEAGGPDDGQVADRALTLAETVLPALRQHITYVEGADAPGAPPFPVHRMGPIYGWALTPGQSGTRRLAQRTPVRGLYLAGQWTQPGPGVMPVIASGLRAARLVLGASTRAGLLPVGLPSPSRVTVGGS